MSVRITRRRVILTTVAFLLAAALVLQQAVALSNDVYYRGFQHGSEAMAYAEHGSPAHPANTDDTGRLDPYDHGICDNSFNGAEAVGITVNSNFEQSYTVRDNNGAGGGCNWNSIPIRGNQHFACATPQPAGCGPYKQHRKARTKK